MAKIIVLVFINKPVVFNTNYIIVESSFIRHL